MTEKPDVLREEYRLFFRYLLGREGPPRGCDLYVTANRKLAAILETCAFPAAPRLALRRPWALPLLDAALAIWSPCSLLRAKLTILAAIAEALPEMADRFLPPPTSAVRLAVVCCVAAMRTATRAALGTSLLLCTGGRNGR